jgi:hypothetical protein
MVVGRSGAAGPLPELTTGGAALTGMVPYGPRQWVRSGRLGAPLITRVGTAAGSEWSGLLTKTAVDPVALTVDRPT